MIKFTAWYGGRLLKPWLLPTLLSEIIVLDVAVAIPDAIVAPAAVW